MLVENAGALNERERGVLRDVVYAYISAAEPVSSRSVAKQRRISAATVRNVMADLDDLGFLTQPHTSAGRIPTAEGYHVFIESLMNETVVSNDQQVYIEQHLEEADDAEKLTRVASHLLSELSHQAGVVLVPARGDIVLRRIEFVPLPGSRLLCVVVSASGFIDHRVIEAEEHLSREELVRISNYLTTHFSGLTLFETRRRLLRLMADERALMDQLMQRSIALASRGLDASRTPGVHVEGAESLLGQPEMADVERIRKLLEAFADKAQLVSMLTRCVEGEGVRVVIGEDDQLTSELDFSLVATTYGVGDETLGSLGIFGPSRMAYPQVIPLVHFLGQAVSQVLSGRGARAGDD